MAETNFFRRLLFRPLFWALIYGALIVYGAYALYGIPVEVLPRFNFPEISVITHEPGATATELEMGIARPIEDEILALPNLLNVRSSMGSGTVETDARFREGSNPEQDLMAVNSVIDRVRGKLPAAVQPVTQIMGNNINEVADYSLRIPAADSPAQVEQELRANIVPELRALPGVYQVLVYGSGEESLWVQPDLAAMHRYQVPVTAIVHALRQQVLIRPGGYLTQGHQDSFIEVRSLPSHVRDLEQVAVAGAKGPIPLHDLARIVRAPVPTLNAAILDGQPSVALVVFKQPDASTVPVDQGVRRVLSSSLAELPQGVHWVNIYDQGHLVHRVSSDLGRNLLVGGLLAIMLLLWVLGAGRGI